MQQISDSDSDSSSDSNSDNESYFDEYSMSILPHSSDLIHRNWIPYRSGDCSLCMHIPHVKILDTFTKNGKKNIPIKKGFPYIINGYKVWLRAIYYDNDNGIIKYSLQILIHTSINLYGWASARRRIDTDILTVFTGKSGWKSLEEIVDRLP